MATLDITPAFRDFLTEAGLTTPEAFLQLQGVIQSGHLDRNVSRLTITAGGETIEVYCKREHCVRWRDRWQNAFAGFGWVSKSRREFAVLTRLRECGIACPQPIAAGEDGRGRAFLLLQKIDHVIELRPYLMTQSAKQRRQLARELGVTLAHIHNAGIDHPDLYAKHIFVRTSSTLGRTGLLARPKTEDKDGPGDPSYHREDGPGDPSYETSDGVYTILDWQRSRLRSRVDWRCRYRDLAALDATLADHLASASDRLACLQAYLDATNINQPTLQQAAREIRRRAERLLHRRRIREIRDTTLATGTQSLIWIDGIALSITGDFHEQTQGKMPDYLRNIYHSKDANQQVSLPNRQPGRLLRRRRNWLGRWLWSWFRRRTVVSPELQQAGTIFRLERYRVKVPQLLAVGQRQTTPWCLESFLLLEDCTDRVDLAAWWQQPGHSSGIKKQVIEQAARCVRGLHECGYALGTISLRVRLDGAAPQVMLADVAELESRRHVSFATKRQDLRRLRQTFSPCRKTEQLRFLLHYLGQDRGTHRVHEWLTKIDHDEKTNHVGRVSQPVLSFLRRTGFLTRLFDRAQQDGLGNPSHEEGRRVGKPVLRLEATDGGRR